MKKNKFIQINQEIESIIENNIPHNDNECAFFIHSKIDTQELYICSISDELNLAYTFFNLAISSPEFERCLKFATKLVEERQQKLN